MDGLTAFVEIVKATAWPITIFAIVYSLRDSIRQLANSIREGTLKYKELEIAIKRDLGEAKSALGVKSDASPQPKPTETADPIQRIYELAQVSPRAAILEAWLQVETALSRVDRRLNPESKQERLRTTIEVTRQLQRMSLVDDDVMRAILKLRDIRNRTAHATEFQPTIDDAEEYVMLAAAASADLDEVRK